jgi:hypothetical protein
LWNLVFDWGCNGRTGSTTWNLKGDKTFESSGGYRGTWEVSGKQITVRYASGTTYSGTINSEGTFMNGTMVDYEGGTGCWNASHTGAGAKSVVTGDDAHDEAGKL